VVDKTGYKNRIDFELDKFALGNLPMLKKQLRRNYDLDLIESVEEVDILVIREMDGMALYHYPHPEIKK
jgi:hypothetical protein